jgi:hypothetical protein
VSDDEGGREFWTSAVLLAVYGGAYVGSCAQALRTLITRHPWSWSEMLLSSGTWTVGMLLASGLLRAGWFPSWGDREGRTLVRTALATGELPPDARRSAWATLLEAEIRELRQRRWVALASALTVTGLVAGAAVVTGDQGVWYLAIALGGFASTPFRLLKVRRERAEVLLARVVAG